MNTRNREEESFFLSTVYGLSTVLLRISRNYEALGLLLVVVPLTIVFLSGSDEIAKQQTVQLILGAPVLLGVGLIGSGAYRWLVAERKFANDSENEAELVDKTDYIRALAEALSEHRIFTAEQRKALHNGVLKAVQTAISKDIISSVRDQVMAKESFDHVAQIFADLRTRLNDEIRRLEKRSAANLVIGMSFSFIAILILVWTLVFPPSRPVFPPDVEVNEWVIIVRQFGPRLSIVVLIQILAYFFLRLYRDTLFEIKYFQNEITTAESKIIGMQASLLSSDEETIKNSIGYLSSTERNFVLSKGQSTVDIEVKKADVNAVRQFLDGINNIVRPSRKE